MTPSPSKAAIIYGILANETSSMRLVGFDSMKQRELAPSWPRVVASVAEDVGTISWDRRQEGSIECFRLARVVGVLYVTAFDGYGQPKMFQ